MALKIVVLAAGKGSRMFSVLPKVMHTIAGVPMLERVVRTAQKLNPQEIFVVHGLGSGTKVVEFMDYLPVTWVAQKEQLGTGHAVQQVLPLCNSDDRLLVLYGDVPLISEEILNELLKSTPMQGLGLIVTEMKDPTGFGRIVRNELGNILQIVEHRDADSEQLKLKEINTGIMIASIEHLNSWLPKLKNKNHQKEYYLTDIVAIAVSEGVAIGGATSDNYLELLGVNDKWQQAQLERYYHEKVAHSLAMQGVSIRDYKRLDFRREQLDISADVVLDINVVLQGEIKIGRGSVIGQNSTLKDVVIGEGVIIESNAVIEGCVIESGAIIGPFARLRPGTHIKHGAKVGNFVEIKNSEVGVDSKVNHLSYIGDCTIGEKVNVGAGAITCNYDGANKHRTVIDDNAFIGSNVALVAPVKVGKGATIGAGSVVSRDAPADKLTLARSRQETIQDWSRDKQII
jgi:bifunctional UDP-N-acetylglucosamine pyrophosphorylase / glucosamine-1-phosphate N-acetyltransferase